MASDIQDQNNIGQCGTTSWGSLVRDLQDFIVAHLPFHKVFHFQTTCKEYQNITAQETFLQARLAKYGVSRPEGRFSPMFFFIDPATRMWEWVGFNVSLNQWDRLPSLSFLASPNPDLFKEFLIAGCGGLLCVNISKNPSVELLIVCNPLTRAMRELPPMHFRRQPVLVNLVLDPNTGNYKVIVAGSATIGTEALSRKTEVYDSATCTWEVTGDVPGPEYALNEYQTGVVWDKSFLFCVGFLAPEDYTTTVARGVLVYDIAKKVWIQHDGDGDEQLRWLQLCELPSLDCCRRPASPNYLTQIFECEGSIFVYWEQEHSRTIVHSCVAQLELSAIFSYDSSVRATPGHPIRSPWSIVVHDDKVGSRGLLVYPEHVSVGHSANKVCIFNSVDLTSSMTYEIGPRAGPDLKPMPLPKPPLLGSKTARRSELGACEKDEMLECRIGNNCRGDDNNNARTPLFFSLNPLSFAFEPSFNTVV